MSSSNLDTQNLSQLSTKPNKNKKSIFFQSKKRTLMDKNQNVNEIELIQKNNNLSKISNSNSRKPILHPRISKIKSNLKYILRKTYIK